MAGQPTAGMPVGGGASGDAFWAVTVPWVVAMRVD